MLDRSVQSSSALAKLLEPYTDISRDQVRRLVAGTSGKSPSLEVLNALCKAIRCGINDLIAIDDQFFRTHLAGRSFATTTMSYVKVPPDVVGHLLLEPQERLPNV